MCTKHVYERTICISHLWTYETCSHENVPKLDPKHNMCPEDMDEATSPENVHKHVVCSNDQTL